MKHPIWCLTRNGRKRIGNVDDDDGIFRKPVLKSKHYCRIYGAWGVQEEAIPDLERYGCKEIEVIDKESGTIYRCSFKGFMKHGIRRDLGDGMQIFLPVKYWQVSYQANLANPNNGNLVVPRQLSLF